MPLSLPYYKIHLHSTGTGSQLLLYDLETGKLLKSFHVFQGIRVHGITCTSITAKDIEFNIAVFGERRVKLFKLCINVEVRFQDHPQESIPLILLHSLPKFSHWVLDVCFLKVITLSQLSIHSSSVHFWHLNTSDDSKLNYPMLFYFPCVLVVGLFQFYKRRESLSCYWL